MEDRIVILGSKGTPHVEFGGARAWRVYSKGDIVVSYQWIDTGDESGEPQPCMCLYPANRRMEVGAMALPADNAYLYATNKGYATPHLVGAAFKGAIAMGFEPTKAVVGRIITLVLDGLEDLIRMPTAQPADLDVARATMGIEVQVKAAPAAAPAEDAVVIHETVH
jgi:hypothetical protein